MFCTFVLYVKFLLTLVIQGGKRFKAGSRPPEDCAFKALAGETIQTFGMNTSATPSAEDEEAKKADIRWARIVMNDLGFVNL